MPGIPWELPPSHGSNNLHRTGRLGITQRIDVFDPKIDTSSHSYDEYFLAPRRLTPYLSTPSFDGSGILSMSESFEPNMFGTGPPAVVGSSI
jgi:hypothetical protein